MEDVLDKKVKAIFESIKNLLTGGAVMVIGASVEKFKELITPVHPMSSTIASATIIIIGFCLSVLAVMHGMFSLGKAFEKSRWQIYIAIGLLGYLWSFIIMAIWFGAIKSS